MLRERSNMMNMSTGAVHEPEPPSPLGGAPEPPRMPLGPPELPPPSAPELLPPELLVESLSAVRDDPQAATTPATRANGAAPT